MPNVAMVRVAPGVITAVCSALENLGTRNSTDAMCRYWARLLWSSKLVPAAMGRMLLRLLKLNNRVGRPGR